MAWSVQDEARRQAEDAGRRFERQQQQSQHGRVAAARVTVVRYALSLQGLGPVRSGQGLGPLRSER